jgi:hypothetical protein
MGLRWRAAVVAAGVAVAVVAPVAQADRAGSAARPTVVVAVADSGVNPYHRAFYRPGNTAHPCTYVKGFTNCSLPALELSVGKYDDPAKAFEADREVWDSVQTGSWYWIPRTNIIGAVCDQPVGGGPTDRTLPTRGPTACIFDENGHGTGTASSVLSEAPDALLLVHEGNNGAYRMTTAPVTADVQSHSWGFYAPLPLQALKAAGEDWCRTGEARDETLVFLAAGNEVPAPTLADCWRQKPEVQVIGGGYPGSFQANSWTVYDFASWFCRPVAAVRSTKEYESSCGTSFAAPTAAGAAAAALQTIREHDGYTGRSSTTRMSPSVTREAFVEALRSAASYKPKAKFPESVPCADPTADCFTLWQAGWAPLPEQAPYLFWGYGWLDSTVTGAVVSCALGRACPAKSQEAQDYNAQRQELRRAFGLDALAPAPGDDARSGRDAGPDAKTGVRIAAGTAYDGALRTTTDWDDGYLVRGRAGQALSVTSSGSPEPGAALGCWSVFGPDGQRLTPTSTGNVFSCEPGARPTGLRLPESGVYTVVYSGYVQHDYSFSVKVG